MHSLDVCQPTARSVACILIYGSSRRVPHSSSSPHKNNLDLNPELLISSCNKLLGGGGGGGENPREKIGKSGREMCQ